MKKFNECIRELSNRREQRLQVILSNLTTNEQLLAGWRAVTETEADQQQPPQSPDALRAAITAACNIPFREEEKESAAAVLGGNMMMMGGMGNMQGMAGMAMVGFNVPQIPPGQDVFASQVMPQAYQQQQAAGLAMAGPCACQYLALICVCTCESM